MRGRGESKTLINLALTGAILIVASLFILFPTKVSASGDHLVINEIYPNTKDSSEQEWVELYIPNNSVADFSGLYFEKANGSIKPATCDDFSNGYYVCYFGNIGYSWLLNTGDTIKLKDSSGIIDQATFPDFTSYKGKSISRIPNGQDIDNDFKIVPITKGYRNYEPPPIIYSDKIHISEIVPQPADGQANEFIELYNSGDLPEYLLNWKLDDILVGGSIPFKFGSTIIGAHSYLRFYNKDTKIILNDNPGDSACLIDPNDTVRECIPYSLSEYKLSHPASSSYRGKSYSLFDGGWLWTDTLTPRMPNIYSVEVEIIDSEDGIVVPTDIKTARAKEDGETVAVTGTVSVIPEVLSNQYFYIQDDSSGIQIYNYDKLFPTLRVGDVVSVTGEFASISNERRIKILLGTDVIFIRQNSPPVPRVLSVGQIGEENEGTYIEINGVVTETSGSTFYVSDGGIIKVYIRNSDVVNKPKMRKGDHVMVSGIISQYKNEYRVLPFSAGSVKILTSGKLPEAGYDALDNSKQVKQWRLRHDQPMRRKRLVTNLEKL